MNKIAVVMNMPEGKLPGFYAQIVKGIAEKVMLFDRDKETLVVSSEEEQEAVLSVLGHYKVEVDILPLLLLPDDALVTNAFSDYGFESRLENRYVFADQTICFQLIPEADSEPSQATAQIEEHLIAVYPGPDGRSVYVVDRELSELMEGIAKAYGCTVHFLP